MAADPRDRSDLADLALLDLHARTLFTHDAAGRLVAINELRRRPAARLFLGWTERAVICRVRHDLPVALVTRLEALVSAASVAGDRDRLPPCLPAIRAALAEHAPVVDHDDGGGPAYRFPDVIAPRPGAVAVTSANADVLRRWLPEWIPDADGQLPVMTVLVDGAAVAICACARVPGAATEAGVETHPAFRGHGHAATVTAAWAQAMRARGVTPLYSTSWQNHASQRVAAKLGLLRYGASLSIE
jgi:ribosomal protein S18 acetylase RimI-like enzyme